MIFRAFSLIDFTSREEDLHTTALKLFREFYPLEPLRLLGVRVSALTFSDAGKETAVIDKYLKPVTEPGKIPLGKPKLKSATPVPELPPEKPLLEEPQLKAIDSSVPLETVSQQPSTPLLAALLGPAAKPKGIKILRLQCPVCQKWRSTTEYLMSLHVQECTSALSSPKPRRRRRENSMSMDSFTVHK